MQSKKRFFRRAELVGGPLCGKRVRVPRGEAIKRFHFPSRSVTLVYRSHHRNADGVEVFLLDEVVAETKGA